jgi:hypothetical protein
MAQWHGNDSMTVSTMFLIQVLFEVIVVLHGITLLDGAAGHILASSIL